MQRQTGHRWQADYGWLEMFENIAFIMAKHADASIPDTPEEWMDQFNTFSMYTVRPFDGRLRTVKVKFFAPRQIQRRLFAALVTLSRKGF